DAGSQGVELAGEDLLGGRERDEDLVVTAEAEGRALRLEHADDLEVDDPRALRVRAPAAAAEDLSQLDRLTDRIGVAEEARRGRRAEHCDLRVDRDLRLG